MTVSFSEKTKKYLFQLKEDRIEEALEYALELLKKEALTGSAAKYFYKNYSQKVELEKTEIKENETMKSFSKIKNEVYKKVELEKTEEIKLKEDIEELSIPSFNKVDGILDLTEF